MKNIIYLGYNKSIIDNCFKFLSPNRYKLFIFGEVELLEDCILKYNIDILLLEDNSINLSRIEEIMLLTKLNNLDINIILIYKINSKRLNSFLENNINDSIPYPFTHLQINNKLLAILFPNPNNKHIKSIIEKQISELNEVKSVMIDSLSNLAEYRDNETGGHIKRTQNYVKALALELRKDRNYADLLNDEYIELIYLSVPLHDIGKVGIRDNILLKPGKLTKEEFEKMKLHTIIGHEAILNSRAKLKNNLFLKLADDVAYTHHEKWDGTGYPQGLKGEEIPLVGRLMALADVYDALVSKRVYKEAFSHDVAKKIILEEKGRHFDPNIVDLFLKLEETFKKISIFYSDSNYMNNYILKDFNVLEEKIGKILLVDDQEILLRIMSNVIKNIGFEVFTTTKPQEAIEIIEGEDIPILITDLEMPNLDGFQLTKEIRKTNKKIYIIALTSSQFNYTKKDLINKGFNNFLLKPLDVRYLMEIINLI